MLLYFIIYKGKIFSYASVSAAVNARRLLKSDEAPIYVYVPKKLSDNDIIKFLLEEEIKSAPKV